ncbi:MAG: hypothetical protein H6807_01255 [Planctomycetes bacterium]|nr:hypothetical protein [Planctomycetota bacterium]
MNQRILPLALSLLLLLPSCATTGGSRNDGPSGEPQAKGKPSVLKLEAAETPAAVRAIETRIDESSVILASEAVIEVSKNYEMDVSVSGDDVSNRDLDPTGGVLTLARGKCTVFVRNLKIVCDRGVRVQIADFGTKPFINVSARGHCSHIIAAKHGQEHEVKRAQLVFIRNDELRYSDELAESIAAFGN